MMIDIIAVVLLILYFGHVIYKLIKNRHVSSCSNCSKSKHINHMVKNIRKEIKKTN